jgi:hypothetical protein
MKPVAPVSATRIKYPSFFSFDGRRARFARLHRQVYPDGSSTTAIRAKLIIRRTLGPADPDPSGDESVDTVAAAGDHWLRRPNLTVEKNLTGVQDGHV